MKYIVILLIACTLYSATTKETHLDGKCISDKFFLPCRVYSTHQIGINGKRYTKYRIIDVVLIKDKHMFMIKENK